MFINKNDLTISSRITDFNVQISAVNIHSHCSKMVGQNFKLNLSLSYFSHFMIIIIKTTYGHSNIHQNHGRSNKLPITIVIFFL